MYPISIGLAVRNNALWSDVTAALRDLPFRVIFDHPEVEERQALLARIERSVPDVVVLECTQLMDGLEQIVAAIRATGPAPMVIAVHAAPELASAVTALRAGVFEFLYPPLADNLRKALERAQGMVHRKAPGKVYGFLSAKGGCGATTVACHVAAGIGRRGERDGKHTLLIDLDLNTGMVRFLMRTQTPYSVLDAASNLQRLDIGYWKALTTQGAPGLDVIAAPAELVSKHQLNRYQVQQVLSFARSYYNWTVVDLGRGLGLLTMTVLDEVDELFLVTTPEVPALHLTRKITDVLRASSFNPAKIHIVGNRMDRNAMANAKELEQLLEVPLYASLPNEYSRLAEAYAECRLLAKSGALSLEMDRLAARLIGEKSAQEQKPAGSWMPALSWFPRRSLES